MSFPAGTGAAAGLASCHVCWKLAPEDERHCPRCGAKLHLRTPDSLARTLALVVTATILYIPANVLPIMVTDTLVMTEQTTILGGVVLLWNLGSYPVAAVIFFASIFIPSSKLLILYGLCWSVWSGHAAGPQQRTLLYRIIEFIGKWSMIDVFVVAVLVALIRLGGVLTIQPGPAVVAFGAVVALTMIAAEGFDTRLIWDKALADE